MKTLLFVAILCGAVFLAAQEAAQVIHGLKLPLKRHANGRTEIFLSADKAAFNADTISAEGNISVLLLSETGVTNGMIRALKGDFDRAKMTAYCHGPVMMEKDSVCILGENFTWNAETQKATIGTNAVLLINRGGTSIVNNL